MGDELFEVFMNVKVTADFRFTTDAKFDRNRSCLVIITREPGWNIDGKDISWRIHLVHEPFREDTVSLVHVKFEEGVETVFSPTCIEGEFRP